VLVRRSVGILVSGVAMTNVNVNEFGAVKKKYASCSYIPKGKDLNNAKWRKRIIYPTQRFKIKALLPLLLFYIPNSNDMTRSVMPVKP